MTAGKTVAIIPVRGGSRGIPRKNARLLAGKPLLAYSVEAVLSAQRIEAVYVSTDDAELAEIARRCGVKVSILRETVQEKAMKRSTKPGWSLTNINPFILRRRLITDGYQADFIMLLGVIIAAYLVLITGAFGALLGYFSRRKTPLPP